MNKPVYDIVIVTHLPAFYKINLYNEIAKKKRILVFYVSTSSDIRNTDFTSGKMNFEYKILNNQSFEKRKGFKSARKLLAELKKIEFSKILVGGWDLIEFWAVVFRYSKKAALTLESSLNESVSSGLKGFIKKLFVIRVQLCFASGNEHVKLLESLNFKGEVRITRGVGIIKKGRAEKFEPKEYSARFLFVGRLSAEKNIEWLIDQFKGRKETLSIVGYGPDENLLKMQAGSNVSFLGAVSNENLSRIYMEHDFFILPSLSEPWGLVVEEALYNSIPVIVSDKCGAKELIKNGVNGFIIRTDSNDLSTLLDSINAESYKRLELSGLQTYINDKDLKQVEVYL